MLNFDELDKYNRIRFSWELLTVNSSKYVYSKSACCSLLSGTLSEGVDLSGIEVLETDRRTIAQARVEVESQAQKMLHTGMSNLVRPGMHFSCVYDV